MRNARLKALVLVVLCLLPVLGGLRMGLSGGNWLPLAMYPLVSLVSLLLYWQDKQQARSEARRTPEKVLHASELLGAGRGFAGSAVVSAQDPQGFLPGGVLGDRLGAPAFLG